MDTAKSILKRIETLIKEGEPLGSVAKKGFGYEFQEKQDAEGWLVSAANAIQSLITSPTNPYWQKSVSLTTNSQVTFGRGGGGTTPNHISSMLSLLQNLSKDIEAGLVGNLTTRVTAEIFDDFLDHADEYLKRNRISESGVIAGVVFEDTIRKLGKQKQILETDVEQIIVKLVKSEIFTEIKAKRARVAAGVRTKATHAQWNDFDRNDVKTCIDFTRELIFTFFE